MPTYENIRLINTILHLYYEEGLTQADIARRFNLSSPKVNRLIQQAHKQGYVSIVIRTPFQHMFELEARLKAVFGLQDALVIPAVGDTNSSILSALGTVGANYLLEHLRDGDVVAITPGTTLQAVVQSIDPARQYQVEVVPMLGSIQGDIESDMNFLASQMGERLGARAYQLHAPAFTDTCEQCEIIKSMEPVRRILDIARKANIALLGIGTVDPDTSRFVQFTALKAEDMQKIANRAGGVGEISAQVYDIEGRPVGLEYAERVIGLSLAEIRRIPFRIGIAASAAKALPIYGALRGGYLHALITDETTASGVLDIFDQSFRKPS